MHIFFQERKFIPPVPLGNNAQSCGNLSPECPDHGNLNSHRNAVELLRATADSRLQRENTLHGHEASLSRHKERGSSKDHWGWVKKHNSTFANIQMCLQRKQDWSGAANCQLCREHRQDSFYMLKFSENKTKPKLKNLMMDHWAHSGITPAVA